MGTFWEIALEDYEQAVFCKNAGKNKYAVYHFQQFAEKGAKALLEKIDPEHKNLKSHRVETIIASYDNKHRSGELSDKARYLTSFYYDTRYPGDNYADIIDDVQAENALLYSDILKEYFVNEFKKIEELTVREIPALDSLKPVGKQRD